MPLGFLNAIKKKDISFVDSLIDEQVIFLADNSEGFTTILDKNKLHEMLHDKINKSDYFYFDIIYRKDTSSNISIVVEVIVEENNLKIEKETELWIINFKKNNKNISLCKFYIEKLMDN